jgi:hypothetical protein
VEVHRRRNDIYFAWKDKEKGNQKTENWAKMGKILEAKL